MNVKVVIACVCLALLLDASAAVQKKHLNKNKHHKGKKWWFTEEKDGETRAQTARSTGSDPEKKPEDGDGSEATEATNTVSDKPEDPCAKSKDAEGNWVRHAFRDLEDDEKELYFKAVNLLKKNGGYDAFPQQHKKLDSQIHGTPWFLPWHRKFLMNFEQALRDQGDEFKCITLPYWDWTADAADPASAAVFTKDAFGTWKEGCVDDGKLAGWKAVVNIGKECLHRNPGGGSCGGWPSSLMGPAAVMNIVVQKRFDRFWQNLEGAPHGGPHCFVGGNMAKMSSPDDPLFFSHHAFIDKLWWDWQVCHGYDKIPSSDYGKGSGYSAFTYPKWLDVDMVMHEDHETCHARAVMNILDHGFVYSGSRFNEATEFKRACQATETSMRFKGMNDTELVNALLEASAGSLIKDQAKIYKNTVQGDFLKKVGGWFKSMVAKLKDVRDALFNTGEKECQAIKKDGYDGDVPNDWAKMNGLNCADGYCHDVCAVLEKKEEAPGYKAADNEGDKDVAPYKLTDYVDAADYKEASEDVDDADSTDSDSDNNGMATIVE